MIRSIPKPFNLIIPLMAILFILSLGIQYLSNGFLCESKEEYERVYVQMNEYKALKEQWHVDENSNDFRSLNEHPKLLSYDKRGKKYRFQFDNLSSSEFDEVANRILNTSWTIKKLEMRNKGDGKGYVSVEFES